MRLQHVCSASLQFRLWEKIAARMLSGPSSIMQSRPMPLAFHFSVNFPFMPSPGVKLFPTGTHHFCCHQVLMSSAA